MPTFSSWSWGWAMVALTTLPVGAQCVPPAAGVSPDEAMLDVIRTLANNRNTAAAVEATPLAGPRGVQLTASPADGATSALAAAAEGPGILGLALESGVVRQEDGKLTVGTSVFGLRMLFNPNLWYDQTAYEEAKSSRKINFKATFGGKGEKLDRNGDGTVDDPLDAKELGDIVAWEVQYRFTKSRDRREGYNWARFRDAMPALVTSNNAFADFLGELARDKDFEPIRSEVENGCWLPADVAKLKQFVSQPGKREIYVPLARALTTADAALTARLKSAAEEVDKRPMASLAAGGIERKDAFGNDVLYLVLRGDKAFEVGNLKLNLEWRRVESAAGEDPTTLIGALEGTKLLFKGRAPNRDIEGSFAASYERYRDVPGVDDGTNAKAQLKLVLPIAEGLTLPLSIAWANHKDLLDQDSEIVGHFGLAFDMSQILKLPMLGGG